MTKDGGRQMITVIIVSSGRREKNIKNIGSGYSWDKAPVE